MKRLGKQIIEMALENGATVAGIASRRALQSSASHVIYHQLGEYTGVGVVKNANRLPKDELFNWPEPAQSVLVIGLSHPVAQPQLDWWDGKGTSGNRRMIEILELTRQQIEKRLQLRTGKLNYYVEKGGIFLKDAAVLAGLGTIGFSNMLVTPNYGPRIRLRGLFLDATIDPTGPITFSPCAECDERCRSVCPEKALDRKMPVFETIDSALDLPARDGAFNREACNIRMEKDVAESSAHDSNGRSMIRYCRKCEFVCPVGKSSGRKESSR